MVAKSGKVLVGINKNYGDSATIKKTCASSVKSVCDVFDGNNSGKEPSKVSSGPDSNYCLYKTSDISSSC